MAFFDKDFDNVEELKKEKLKLQEEHEKIREVVELKAEIEKERQAIKELKSGGNKYKGGSSSAFGDAIKGTFQGIGSVLGEMAKNSQVQEQKDVKKKKNRG